MLRSVMLAKMLTCAVQASFHRGDAGIESFGNFGMAATFLHEGEESTILRPQLRQSMAERVEFLGIHRAGRLRNVLMLLSKREEYASEFLTAELIDTRVAREPKEPRFELGRRLQTVDRPDHLDENLL